MTLVRLAVAAAAIALCAGCQPAETAPRAATRADPPLAPFYRALDTLRDGTQVNIVQIGDSHTANDAFSGRMRSLLQQRFGSAGRGMLPPGIPFRTYNPAQVSVTASGWHVVSSFDAAAQGPFGIAGLRQSARGQAEMTLRASDPSAFDNVLIEALGQPGGGTIEVAADGGPARMLRTGSARGAAWLNVPAQDTVTLRARGDGLVDILSWTATRRHRGVAYTNLGTIGATIDLLGRWDHGLVAAEMARLRPALILVAFGTNEGFRDATDPVAYQARYAENVRLLHDAAPGAAILVVGPPDGSRHAAPSDRPACREHSGWTTPPRLADLREAQRQVALAGGYGFWDWSAAMGGACTMPAWASADPPLASADHVHLLTRGYQATADKLFEDLMQGYQEYLGRRGGAH